MSDTKSQSLEVQAAVSSHLKTKMSTLICLRRYLELKFREDDGCSSLDLQSVQWVGWSASLINNIIPVFKALIFFVKIKMCTLICLRRYLGLKFGEDDGCSSLYLPSGRQVGQLP